MFILICSLLVSATAAEVVEELDFAFEGMSNCEGYDSNKFRMEDLEMEQIDQHKISMSGVLVMEEEVTNTLVLKMILSKCPSKAEKRIMRALSS
ncbi:hypothetical protein L9F63_009334 [Diploptera punctata]|uniref:Uncharacterized protein n=1 Tax=Diploptera punctata TaxID=6984 RepID=A0AAD8AJS5_DIPPU|nr:hypothetical protein L9F63_009334 [Diploptera punctata]